MTWCPVWTDIVIYAQGEAGKDALLKYVKDQRSWEETEYGEWEGQDPRRCQKLGILEQI